jgi:hypothetical protein
MGNYYSLYSKNLGLSGKMVWWSTEPNWSTKLGDLTGCLILTLNKINSTSAIFDNVCFENFVNVKITLCPYRTGIFD